ncbi:MAG: nicotinamide riboside transporter PnuC [Pirellulales bacterium]
MLSSAIVLLAGAAAWFGLASWLEAVSFVTGAICVWLTVKESIWNFPVGLANVATFGVVFFRSRLLADAALQAVYFVLGAIGWWTWVYGGENRTALRITRASRIELGAVGLSAAAATLGIWQLLQLLGGSASFWDALTTSLSLASQWLLNRKKLESWVGWIAVDVIYVPLYLWKELYLTSVLYALFLALAVMGYRAWRATWHSSMDAPLGHR